MSEVGIAGGSYQSRHVAFQEGISADTMRKRVGTEGPEVWSAVSDRLMKAVFSEGNAFQQRPF